MKLKKNEPRLIMSTKLPEDCSLDDIQYHLYVLQTVERGRNEIAQREKLSHEEVKRELREKWAS